MPIPNVSILYQRIGAEGGHEFARFVRLLLSADYSSQRIHTSESDASGDIVKSIQAPLL